MYVHDMDPFAIQIYQNFGVRWYGLSYMMGFIFAYLLISWLVERQRAGMTAAMVSDYVTYNAIGILVGGRLGYCLFYSPDLFLRFKSSFPFWGVLAVNEGGMASHGGMIGIAIACFLFAKKHNLNLLYLFDLAALTGPIGIFMGRIANFINGELVGRPAPENYPLAVKFPQDLYLWPSQEVGKLPELGPVVEKLGLEKGKWLEWTDKFRYDSMAREEIHSYIEKIIQAIQNGNVEVKQALAPLLTPRHPSQLYGALAEGLILFLILFFLWRKPKKPGMIAASFVFFYSIARISDEMFRMPDAHIGFQWLGLTRGQWLSIAQFLIGAILLFIWSRSGGLSIQGWKKSESIRVGRLK